MIEDGWCWTNLHSLTVLRPPALGQISVCHNQSLDHHQQHWPLFNEERTAFINMKFCDCLPFILLWIIIGLFGTQARRPQQLEGEIKMNNVLNKSERKPF